MKYEVNTVAGSNGRIISTVDYVDDTNMRLTIFRHVLDTQDKQVRAALEDRGWRYDGGIAAIDVPNDPCAPVDYSRPPLGHHRVTMADIIAMERKLNALKRAFNS